MANKVTNEDILQINSLYFQYKTYAEVARQTGFSASTVKKYVDKNWTPVCVENIIRFDLTQLPDFLEQVSEKFKGIENYGSLCILSGEEKEEMKVLWGEIAV